MSKQKIVNRPPKEDRVTGTETQHEGPVASRSDLEERFAALADQWRREVAFSSSVNEMVEHPAYRSIIGMGPAVVPLILREMQQEPDHWFWSLTAITGENPVRPEEAGDLDRMTETWLAHGRKRGYL